MEHWQGFEARVRRTGKGAERGNRAQQRLIEMGVVPWPSREGYRVGDYLNRSFEIGRFHAVAGFRRRRRPPPVNELKIKPEKQWWERAVNGTTVKTMNTCSGIWDISNGHSGRVHRNAGLIHRFLYFCERVA